MLSAFPAAAARLLSTGAQALCLFFVKNDLRHYLRTHYGDHTFQNLYHWQLFSFDTLLLTPYFLVMIVLSIYGLHRYKLVWQYYHYRKNATHQPPSRFDQLPRVTIQPVSYTHLVSSNALPYPE